MRRAIEERYDGTVAVFASGSLSHRFARATAWRREFVAPRSASPFLEQVDHDVVEACGRPATGRPSAACCPMYADKGHGEGVMHDTAMLLGALGWSAYDAPAEIVTPYFGSSGTGQINASFRSRRRRPRDSQGPGVERRGLPAVSRPEATMPHLVILYTPNIEPQTDMSGAVPLAGRHHARAARRRRQAGLSDRRHARAGLSRRRTTRWPTAAATTPSSTSTCAWPRAAPMRCKKRIGDALLAVRQAALRRRSSTQRHIGITLQIDESAGPGLRRQAQQPASPVQQVADPCSPPNVIQQLAAELHAEREIARAGRAFLQALSRR